MNRADPALLDYMRFHLNKVSPEQGENYKLAKEFGTQLLQNCEEALGTNPLYKDGQSFLVASHGLFGSQVLD